MIIITSPVSGLHQAEASEGASRRESGLVGLFTHAQRTPQRGGGLVTHVSRWQSCILRGYTRALKIIKRFINRSLRILDYQGRSIYNLTYNCIAVSSFRGEKARAAIMSFPLVPSAARLGRWGMFWYGIVLYICISTHSNNMRILLTTDVHFSVIYCLLLTLAYQHKQSRQHHPLIILPSSRLQFFSFSFLINIPLQLYTPISNHYHPHNRQNGQGW